MNIERMLILADHLKTVPHAPEGSINTGPGDVSRFNMNHYICGTTACIAGWACELFCPNGSADVSGIHSMAMLKLGLDPKDAGNLFLNNNGFVSMDRDLPYIEPPEAVDAILRMVRAKVVRLLRLGAVSPFGGLHIVIEDLNIDDESIRMCLDRPGLSPDERGVALYMLRLDENGRQDLLIKAGQAQWGEFND
jgi:hypothetical protein